MAKEACNTGNHWAVIIGINYYPNSPNNSKDFSHQSLKGAVRDAETVKHYLESGATPVDIVTLTATTPSDPSSGRPVEEPASWPTRTNVAFYLRRLLNMAIAGDFVYVHYSGHGTQKPSAAQSGHNSRDEFALSLFYDGNGSSYLEGRHLAGVLQRMVEKGLLVTLVLDCCFSGSVMRNSGWHNFDIRSIDYNPNFDAPIPQYQDNSLIDLAGPLRDSRMQENWLVDPDGYTIISACGPHELAWEREIEGERRGLLTYFLIQALSALRKNDVELTHQSLHERLRTQVHVFWPQQNPMRYGNTHLSFFGNRIDAQDTGFVPIYVTDNGQLRLSAGQIHGVHQGDEYAVYPFEMPEYVANRSNEVIRIVQVDAVRSFESDLVEVNQILATWPIKTSWKAKLITSVSPWRIRVGLSSSVNGRSQWKKDIKKFRFLHLCADNDDEGPCIFNLVINADRQYEVVNALHEKIINLPPIPLDSDRSTDTVMDILQHLAIFKYFEGLENRLPNTSFEKSFSLSLNYPTEASGIFRVKHGRTWSFTVENISDQPLYVAIFNFNPSWEVFNIVASAGGDDYLVLPPKTGETNPRQEMPLGMEVPESFRSRGQTQCEDIIKVFFTRKPTSFPTLVLPPISLDANNAHENIRGDGHLSAFLSELSMRSRGQNNALEEQWATRNFIICTTIE